MSKHLQPEITIKQRGWYVETRDAGACLLPGDVSAVPAWLATGVPIDAQDHPVGVFEIFRDLLADYIEGRQIESIEVCEGYFARLSAPGYLDRTDWECHDTIKEARASLRDDY